MATKVWLAPTSADWSIASDWSGGTLPGAGDTALIGQGGAFYTISVSGTASVGSIILDSPTAVLADSGSLQLNGGRLLLEAGTLDLGGGSVSNGTIDIAGGTLQPLTNGTLNSITVEGSLALNLLFGAISASNLALIGQGGTGGGTLNLQSGQLDFTASQTIATGTIELSGNSTNAAYLNAGTGTTLTLGPAFQLQHVGSASVLTGNILNKGTISATATGGTLSVSGGTLSNSGLMSISGGDDVLVLGTLTNSGTIQIGSGGTLGLSGAWSNTGSVVGTGGTIVLGGAVTPGGLQALAGSGAALVLAGALNDSGGTLQVGAGTALGALTLQGILSGGVVQDAGGGIALAGGTLDGVTYVGTLVVPQSLSGFGGGGSFVDGLTLAPGGVVDILGTLTAGNSETIASGTIVIGAVLSSITGDTTPELTTAAGSGATLTLGPQVVVQQNGAVAELGGNITNQGTIGLFVAGGELQLAAGGTLTNQGVLAVGTGETLDLLGSLNNAGRVLLMPGGTLLLNGQLAGSGTITANGGTIVAAGSVATASLLPLLQTGAASVVIDGTLDNSGATLQLGPGASFGSLDVQGTVKGGVIQDQGGGLILDGGTLDGVTYQGTLDVPAGPFDNANLVRDGFALTGVGGIGGGLLNLGGTLTFGNPSTLTAGTIALGGDGIASSSPKLNAASLTLGSQTLVQLVGSQGTIGGNILNQGTIAAMPGSGTLMLPGPAALLNAGLVSIATGATLVADDSFVNIGSLVLTSGSTLDLIGDGFSSTGTISASGATVVASGPITGAELQPFAGSGATVILTGTLDNTAGTLAFGQGGTLGTAILEGTVRGGVVQDPGNGLVLAGGTLDGVTYQGTLDIAAGGSGQIAVDTISDGLTLQGIGGAGAGVVDLAGTLAFATSATLASGTILLDSTGSPYPAYFFPELTTAQGTTLTLGPQTVVRQTGSLGALGGSLVNQGTIAAAGSGADLQLLAGAALSNQGLLAVGNGETLDIEGSLSNSGTLSVAAGGTVSIAGSWSNAGLIQATGGTVVLAGTVTNSELQSFAGSGATLVLAGALSNTGGVLQVGSGAPLSALTLSQGGAISGGVVSSNGPGLIAAGGTLSGVAYQGTLDLSAAGANLTVTNGLTIAGAGGIGQGSLLLTGTGASLAFQGSQTLNGATLVLGAGLTVTAGTLTLGPLMSVQQSGPNGAISGAVVNQGSINANLNGGNLSIASLVNQGGLGVANGDVVSIASLANSGTISVSGNSVLNLGSQAGGTGISNTGRISETGATLNLYGALGLATLQGITRSGGLVTVGGTLAESGGTLAVGAGSALGTLRLTGTVSGGTVLDQGGGMQFYGSTAGVAGGAFQSVTYRGSLDLSPAFSTLTVSGGLTVTGTAGSGPGTINLTGAGSQLAFTGNQTFNSATIYMGNAGDLAGLSLRDLTGTGSVLTLGPSVDIEQRGALAAITADRGLGDGIVNQGTIRAAVAGGSFSIYGGSFTNQGSLDATNGATLAVDPDSFSNVIAGTLSGGIYEADAGSTLFLESAGPLVADNAAIILSGPGSRLLSIDQAHLQPQALEATLGTIGAGGTLALLAGRGFAAASALTDNGQIVLGAGVVQAPAVSIGSGGVLQGSGTIAAQISDFGTITASGGALTLLGGVSGTGTLAISAGATLVTSATIGTEQAIFSSMSAGELALAAPVACSAIIQGFGNADLIDLLGVSATGLTYAATGTKSGVLTVSGPGGTVAQLQFAGSYSTGNFALTPDGQGGTLIKDPPVPITAATLGGPSSMSFLTGSTSRITGQVGTATNGAPQQPGVSGYAAMQDFTSLSTEAAVWAALEAALTSRGAGWPGVPFDPGAGPAMTGAGLPLHSGGG